MKFGPNLLSSFISQPAEAYHTYCKRPLFLGLYLTIVYNYITIAVPNNSLNPAHPIAVAQAKPQPKDQM